MKIVLAIDGSDCSLRATKFLIDLIGDVAGRRCTSSTCNIRFGTSIFFQRKTNN